MGNVIAMEDERPLHHRDVDENGKAQITFWLKIASAVFGMWAIMLPIGITIIVGRMDEIARNYAQQLTLTDLDINKRLYTLEAEHGDVKRRLSVLEDSQRQIDRQILDIQRLEGMRNNGSPR